MMIKLHKHSAGRYEFFRHGTTYQIHRMPDGWRWINTNNLGSGGEWRATRREATLDLMEHLGLHVARCRHCGTVNRLDRASCNSCGTWPWHA